MRVQLVFELSRALRRQAYADLLVQNSFLKLVQRAKGRKRGGCLIYGLFTPSPPLPLSLPSCFRPLRLPLGFCLCLSLAQVYHVWELGVVWWAGWPFMGCFNWRIVIVSWCEGVLAQPALSILRYIQEASDSYLGIKALFALGRVETAAESCS